MECINIVGMVKRMRVLAAIAICFFGPVYAAADQGEIRSLSFVYYPTSSKGLGHVELELNDILWDCTEGKSRPFPDAVRLSTYKKPFFRFVFDPPAGSLQDMQRHIKNSFWSLTCCRAALYPLEQAGVCSVPFAIGISPLYTALYLKTGNMCGLNRVVRIEYYGNPSLTESLSKMLPGVATEALPLVLATAQFFY